MKINVKATVVYPVYINQEFEVPDGTQLREAVLKVADKFFEQGGIDPLITESDNDLLECD